MATFTDLVRAQRATGKGPLISMTSAYNQQQMQKNDPRNLLFSRNGLLTALFPGLKGYQASPVARKGSSPSASLSTESLNSPTALTSIARDARISARNSMALPSIARNMAQMVRIWGGTPAKYFERAGQRESAYEAKFGTGKKGFASLGKSGGTGGGFNVLGMLGGALKGIGSFAGSLLSGATSIIGSILGGIGSLVGGAFSGVFGVLTGALGRMGFMGVVLAGVVGFALYSLYKSLDFSKLGSGIGGALDSIKQALTGLYNELNQASGGKLGNFIDEAQKVFKSTVDKIASGIKVTLNLFRDLGVAVLKDMYGFFTNFFEENKGKIYALMAIGIMGPKALLTLPGATIAAIAAAVGNITGEKSIDQLKSENESLKLELQKVMKEGKQVPTYDQMGNVTGYVTAGGRAVEIESKIKENEALIKEKEARTSNYEQFRSENSLDTILQKYQQEMGSESGTPSTSAGISPTPAGTSSAATGVVDKAGILKLVGKYEGGRLGYIAANKGKAGDMPNGYPGLTELTVGEVQRLLDKKEIFAAGKYQIIGTTLHGLVYDKAFKGQFKENQKFSPELQDKMAMALIDFRLKNAELLVKENNRPLSELSTIQQIELAKEFAVIENPQTKKSFHAGKGGNKSFISTETMQALLGKGSPNQQLASNPPTPTPTPPTPTPQAPTAKNEQSSSSGSTGVSLSQSIAETAHSQLLALDKLTGGKLLKGSTELADMLRDITYEFANSAPTFVDASTKNIVTTASGAGSESRGSINDSAYNKDTDLYSGFSVYYNK